MNMSAIGVLIVCIVASVSQGFVAKFSGCRRADRRSICFMNDLFQEEISKPEPTKSALKDPNGTRFETGSIVRVIKNDLEAFHVISKGTFNENKEFVEGGKSFVLPVGLRGTVTRVYDPSEISAAFPIQVKFTPGEHAAEYDTPIPFIMHLETSEVEIIL